MIHHFESSRPESGRFFCNDSPARVAKLVNAPDLGSGTFGFRGSSPLLRTNTPVFVYKVIACKNRVHRLKSTVDAILLSFLVLFHLDEIVTKRGDLNFTSSRKSHTTKIG